MLDNSAALIFNNSNFKVWHLCLKQQLYKKETNGKLIGQNPQKEKKNIGILVDHSFTCANSATQLLRNCHEAAPIHIKGADRLSELYQPGHV